MTRLFDSFYFRLTYSADEFARALLQQTNYLCLLSGRTPAADHSGTLARELHELIFIVFQTNLQETNRNGQVSNSGHHTQLISTADL